jgi:hypothetical protein
MRRSGRLVFLLSVWCISVRAEPVPISRADLPVAAMVESTLGTASKQIRQLAFDGDPTTFFASTENPGAADHFTLVIDKPVSLKRLTIITGKPNGADKLESGTVALSADGKTFDEAAKFANGTAKAEPDGRLIQAVRITPSGDLTHPLVIRELTIESEPSIATFRYPVEFVVDVSDSPDLKSWADKAARECERYYPMINEELKSEGYKPPQVVTLTLSSRYNGVAAASGSRITGAVKFFKAHPDDVGAMIHETCHVVQQYRGRRTNRNPGWLVEGVADYVRFFKYEPGKIGPINADRAHYNGSYRVTAAFLAYTAEKYDKQLVLKLNTLMREGNYKDEIFKEFTGKSLDELDDEWRASLKK